MAADFNKPAVADNYSTGYTPAIVDNFKALAQGLDPAVVTPSNVPTGAIRWRSANNYWEKYNGTSWVALTATYAISISGNAATATKWATGRTIALTGDVTGTSGAFDGSGNLSFAGTLATVNSNVGSFGGAATALSVTVDGKGRITAINNTAIAIGWAAITSGKPTTLTGYGITDAAASSHTHGNITNDGKIGSTSGLPIITTTGGVMTAGAWGGTGSATTFARSDHTHSYAAINQTMYIGTTAVAINRTTGALSLTGVNIDGSAATATKLANDSGSAPSYSCRAWVNFNGTGTVAIRASGNVSSITDNGVGDYTINFTTSMPDANYCFGFGAQDVGGTGMPILSGNINAAPTVSALRISVDRGLNATGDIATCCVSIFR